MRTERYVGRVVGEGVKGTMKHLFEIERSNVIRTHYAFTFVRFVVFIFSVSKRIFFFFLFSVRARHTMIDGWSKEVLIFLCFFFFISSVFQLKLEVQFYKMMKVKWNQAIWYYGNGEETRRDKEGQQQRRSVKKSCRLFSLEGIADFGIYCVCIQNWKRKEALPTSHVTRTNRRRAKRTRRKKKERKIEQRNALLNIKKWTKQKQNRRTEEE